MSALKTCKLCGVAKPLAEFSPSPKLAFGVSHKCRACSRQYMVQYRAANPEKHRARDRARDRQAERYAQRVAASKKHHRAHPEQSRATSAVYRAIKAGRLAPQPCEVCGSKAQAHHDNYSKPLDVRWLCPTHHSQHHAKQRRTP